MLARPGAECKDELMSKNLLKIIEDYRRLLQKDPNSKAFAPLAEALRENAEFQQAEIVAANGIRRHPDYVGGYVALGRILIEQSRFAEAGPILSKAVELDPQNLLALQLIGTLHLQMQQPKDALKAFKRILFLNPQSEKARNAVQKLESLSADEYEEDIFQYKKINATTQINKPAVAPVSSQELERKLSLVDALIVRNDLEKARAHLLDLNTRLPNNKEIAKRFELLEESLPEEEALPLHPVASREKMVFDKKRQILEDLLRRIKAYTEDSILES
jgi:tetratricopeptide (TPR) repeat protein